MLILKETINVFLIVYKQSVLHKKYFNFNKKQINIPLLHIFECNNISQPMLLLLVIGVMTPKQRKVYASESESEN